MHGFLHDIIIAVIVATATGILFFMLKQPVIIAYLVAGIIIGPEIGPHLVTNPENIETISEIGLCLLLFIVGLEINIDMLRRAGKAMILPGAFQFALSVAFGWAFFMLIKIGVGHEILYIAAACALSSTAVVLKSLIDAHQIETRHGRITIGILVMQDIWAVVALIILPNSGSGEFLPVLYALVRTVILFAGTLLASRYLMKRVFEKLSRFPEMTVVASIGWCSVVSAAASLMNLSPALGAIAAGLSISLFPYHVFVIDKVQPLRDVFLMLFFVSLGLLIPLPDVSLAGKLAIVIGFILVSRFLIIYPLIKLVGGSSRTGFLSCLNLSQISEFSLVIMMTGVTAGHVSKDSFTIVLYAMALTAILSSYLIRYGYPIHSACKKIFNLREEYEDAADEHRKSYPIVILGVHRGSQAIIEMLEKKAPELLGEILIIDYNAEVLSQLKKAGIAGYIGDLSRAEVLEKAGLADAKIIISTIPEMLIKGIDSARLVSLCRMIAPEAKIIASADFKNKISALEDAGASKIILPYFLAGEECADYIIVQAQNWPSDNSEKEL